MYCVIKTFCVIVFSKKLKMILIKTKDFKNNPLTIYYQSLPIKIFSKASLSKN